MITDCVWVKVGWAAAQPGELEYMNTWCRLAVQVLSNTQKVVTTAGASDVNNIVCKVETIIMLRAYREVIFA